MPINKEIQSVCSVCLKAINARVFEKDNNIYIEKSCPEHGKEIILESKGKDFYQTSVTELASPEEPAGPTCVALLEITDACNLECPVCFASSAPRNNYFISLNEVKNRIEKVILKKGVIDILMLSGGEPTVHPGFSQIIDYIYGLKEVKHLMLNTNGINLTKNKEVSNSLLKIWDKLEIYLQFDSLIENEVTELRGSGNILETKLKSLDWLSENSFAVTFAVTLPDSASQKSIKKLIDFAMKYKNIRGITFQPAFASGRHNLHFDPNLRLTTPEVVNLLCRSCPEIFSKEAFINLPCSHPNCAIVAYYYRDQEKLWPLCQDIVPLNSLKKRINFNLEDLKQCGCDNTELGNYIQDAEMKADNSFRVVVKPFMDRFNLNRDRTAQCCTHVLGPGGKLMSFCEYNIFRERLNWQQSA